jgi:hypothetical protein
MKMGKKRNELTPSEIKKYINLNFTKAELKKMADAVKKTSRGRNPGI